MYITLNHSKMLEFWGLSGLKIDSYCTAQNWLSGPCGDSVLLTYGNFCSLADGSGYWLCLCSWVYIACWWKETLITHSVPLGNSSVGLRHYVQFWGASERLARGLVFKGEKAGIQKPAVKTCSPCLVEVHRFPQKCVTVYHPVLSQTKTNWLQCGQAK